MKKSPIKLKERETVVTAYAQAADGPGWANSPLWIILQDGNGKLRQECLQPREQTMEMHWLYRLSQEAHKAMTAAVIRSLNPAKKSK